MSLATHPDSPTDANLDGAELRARYDRYREQGGSAHLRDAARTLGSTEPELLSAGCGGRAVRRLVSDAARLYPLLPSLGELKTMTRNEHAIIEKWGCFEEIGVDGGPLGQVVGSEIDLRLFFRQMGDVFAVTEQGARGERRGFQVFDRYGDASQKIYLEDEPSQRAAYEAMCAELAHPWPSSPYTMEPIPAPPAHKPDDEVDREAFCRDWDAMEDTHAFFGLLRVHGLHRTQALRLAGPDRAREVATSSLETVLTKAAETELSIMIFVGSRGCLQIHCGPVRKITRMSGYLNVLDRRLNLHVADDAITRAYVVRKPTKDGIVTSLELFDARLDTVAMLFGVRKPGQTEVAAWRELAGALS